MSDELSFFSDGAFSCVPGFDGRCTLLLPSYSHWLMDILFFPVVLLSIFQERPAELYLGISLPQQQSTPQDDTTFQTKPRRGRGDCRGIALW